MGLSMSEDLLRLINRRMGFGLARATGDHLEFKQAAIQRTVEQRCFLLADRRMYFGVSRSLVKI